MVLLLLLLLGFFFWILFLTVFLVSYSCTAYKVYSTVVQLFEFNEALPRLQVFFKKNFGIKELPVLVFGKKERRKTKFKKNKINHNQRILNFNF